MPNEATETALVRAFLAREARERYRSKLANPKQRLKMMNGSHWNHDMPLDLRFATKLEAAEQNEEAIETLLRSRGAPDDAYVIGGDCDGETLPLRRALEAIVPEGVGFVSCVPGRLAYYGGEEVHERYILERSG